MGRTSTEIQGIRMFAVIVFNRDRDLKCWWGKLLLTLDSLAVLVWLKKFTGSYSSDYEIATEIIRSSRHFSFTSFFKKELSSSVFCIFRQCRIKTWHFFTAVLGKWGKHATYSVFCALKMVIGTVFGSKSIHLWHCFHNLIFQTKF